MRKNGVIVPAPTEAVEQYVNLKDDWLINHPELRYEKPAVSLAPGHKDGKEGYFVRTEIIYDG